MKRLQTRMNIPFALFVGAASALISFAGSIVNAQQAIAPSLAPQQTSAAQQRSTSRPSDTGPLPAQAPSSPFHIVGTVIDAVTRSPVRNATLTVAPMTTVKKARTSRRRSQNAPDSAITDSDGHFDLTVATAGGWELTAAARTYRTQHFDEHDGYSTAVVLTEAAPEFKVEFRMTPPSIIEGFVLDEAGEPVRSANVALVYLPPPSPDNQNRRPQSRGQQMTDDRGFYKFDAIAPGTYQIRVSAHPWYATAAGAFGFSFTNDIGKSDGAPANSGPDPLDVVYQTMWFPGATDPAAATPIVLHGGETQDANFRLLPVPGSHLHVAGPPDASNGERDARAGLPNTFLSRVLPDGTEDPQTTPTRMDGKGHVDIAGLSPGSYLVHQQSPSGSSVSLSTIQIGTGSSRTFDLNEAVPAANVTVKVDPAADRDSLQISFRDLETGNTLYAQRIQESGRQPMRRRGQTSQGRSESRSEGQDDPSPQGPPAPPTDRTVSLPAGRYEVFFNGAGDLHLAAIEAVGATATGRVVTIGTGAPKLLLHTAAGLGIVTGIVNLQGQADPGAMVLLVPATLGNPSGLDLPSRDQSNTDGSFEMSGLLPGGYILVAIDHGWDVNWADPATLRRFLMHGVPLDIRPNSDIKQTIEAQLP